MNIAHARLGIKDIGFLPAQLGYYRFAPAHRIVALRAVVRSVQVQPEAAKPSRPEESQPVPDLKWQEIAPVFRQVQTMVSSPEHGTLDAVMVNLSLLPQELSPVIPFAGAQYQRDLAGHCARVIFLPMLEAESFVRMGMEPSMLRVSPKDIDYFLHAIHAAVRPELAASFGRTMFINLGQGGAAEMDPAFQWLVTASYLLGRMKAASLLEENASSSLTVRPNVIETFAIDYQQQLMLSFLRNLARENIVEAEMFRSFRRVTAELGRSQHKLMAELSPEEKMALVEIQSRSRAPRG